MTRSGIVKSAVGLVVALMMTTGLSFAHFWSGHKSSVKSANITLASRMTLDNGTVLNAGSYHIEVPQNSKAPEVSFYRNGQVVAKVPAKVVAENQKNTQTEIDSNTRGNKDVITEIRPNGWSEKLVFTKTSG